MKNYIPIIKILDIDDTKGKYISVGVRMDHCTHFLPSLSKEELIELKNKIENFLKNN